MGRMRRQRRYKSCDPYAKNKNVKEKGSKDDSFDRPPLEESNDNHFRESIRFKHMQMAIEGDGPKQIHANATKRSELISEVKSRKRKDKTIKETSLSQKPNETKKQFFQRLDENVQQAINTAMIESKTLRRKRKQHLKLRKEKKKNKKKLSTEADNESLLKDTVAFGEIVEQPPNILVIPRKASEINKTKDLKLMALLANEHEEGTEDINKKKSESEKDSLAMERKRAIDAYRLMKKRKEARHKT